jgi:CobQ/CobB/MinD/ParA nucleotide binding domain
MHSERDTDFCTCTRIHAQIYILAKSQTVSTTFPQPFIITVGMTKGGTHKTWIAFNLASYFGLMGYSVLVVDTNPQHDLAADYQWLLDQGIYPRFDVLVHDPIGVDGMPTKRLDLSREAGRDFIIYDTCQFLQLETMRFTWTNCHAMLAPVTPNCSEIRNYQNALRLYWALPGKRGPVIVLPTGVSPLKNATADITLEQILSRLGKEGCEVPDFGVGNMIDDNPLMRAQLCRWVYAERTVDGQVKTTKDNFLLKVNLSFRWVRYAIEKHYGEFPEPRLPIIIPETQRLVTSEDRKRIFGQLRAEAAQRQRIASNGQ